MTPKEYPQKELKDFLDNLNKKHDSVYKERESVFNFTFDKTDGEALIGILEKYQD